MSRSPRLLAVLVLPALLLGCGQEGDAGPVPAPADVDADRVWDLTWFSDSSAHGALPMWVEQIERTQGVEVRVHDYFHGGRSAVSVLQDVREDASVREAVAASELIVVYGNPVGSGMPTEMTEACVEGSRPEPPPPLSREDVEPFADVLRSIYDEILELREGAPTAVRALDLYVPVGPQWRAAGMYDACMDAWETTWQAARDAATEHGVPMLSQLDLLNGPERDRDLAAAGLLDDDMHLNEVGYRKVAEALHAMGYAPVRG